MREILRLTPQNDKSTKSLRMTNKLILSVPKSYNLDTIRLFCHKGNKNTI